MEVPYIQTADGPRPQDQTLLVLHPVSSISSVLFSFVSLLEIKFTYEMHRSWVHKFSEYHQIHTAMWQMSLSRYGTSPSPPGISPCPLPVSTRLPLVTIILKFITVDLFYFWTLSTLNFIGTWLLHQASFPQHIFFNFHLCCFFLITD